MAIIPYQYVSFKFDREIQKPLFQNEYESLKKNGIKYIDEMVRINKQKFSPFREIFNSYFSKNRTIIYFGSIIFIILLFILDIKANWMNYVSIIPLVLSVWVIIYTFQFGLSMFKTFDALEDYEDELRKYYEHHFKLVERTKNFPEYTLLVSNANIMLMKQKFRK